MSFDISSITNAIYTALKGFADFIYNVLNPFFEFLNSDLL